MADSHSLAADVRRSGAAAAVRSHGRAADARNRGAAAPLASSGRAGQAVVRQDAAMDVLAVARSSQAAGQGFQAAHHLAVVGRMGCQAAEHLAVESCQAEAAHRAVAKHAAAVHVEARHAEVHHAAAALPTARAHQGAVLIQGALPAVAAGHPPLEGGALDLLQLC